jgi:hypothetical protein
MKSNDELIDRHRATAAAERKVIEAAKAALGWVDGCEEFEDAMDLLDACKGAEAALRPAVEALEAAEVRKQSPGVMWTEAWHKHLAQDDGVLGICMKCNEASPGPVCPWCDGETFLRMAENLVAAEEKP